MNYTKRIVILALVCVLMFGLLFAITDRQISKVAEQVSFEAERIDKLEVELEEIGTFHEWIEDDTPINYRETLRQACREWGIDEYLGIAISRLETGNWTSYAFVNGFNYGGISVKGEPVMYADECQGLMSYMVTLDAYRGMSVEEMQKKYCPPNKNWTNAVRQIMEEEKCIYAESVAQDSMSQ